MRLLLIVIALTMNVTQLAVVFVLFGRADARYRFVQFTFYATPAISLVALFVGLKAVRRISVQSTALPPDQRYAT